MNIFKTAIMVEGSIQALAKKLELTPAAVSNWKLRKRVPKAWLEVLKNRYGSKA